MFSKQKRIKFYSEKEIEYIEKYIELQKIETSKSKLCDLPCFRIIPGNKTIAPMIFIPFIENAFKHTTNKKIDNAINVHIVINKETIGFIFAIINSIRPAS